MVKAFLVGPTGVGKTEIAVIVARRIGAEILNVDSRQIYSRLDLGTAKPTISQRKAVRHHLINLLEPTERCSAGRFIDLFRAAMEDLRARGRTGLAVGGAGLYVDACLGRFHPLPKADPARRRAYARIEEREGPGSLHRRLASIDPESAERLAPRDLQRIIRALEIVEATGKKMGEHLQGQPESVCDPATPVVYLTRERRDLYARIERRCEAMIASGLPEEVRRLLEGGLQRSAPGFKTLGYTEWAGWALGEYDSDAAMELFVRNSRRYAKRQDTWFRNRHPDRIEVLIAAHETAEESAKRVLDTLTGDT